MQASLEAPAQPEAAAAAAQPGSGACKRLCTAAALSPADTPCTGETPRRERSGGLSRKRTAEVRRNNFRAVIFARTHACLAVRGDDVLWGVAHPFACA